MTETTTNEKVNTLEKVEVSSYPYGGLRTKAYFSIEFNAKKGFRSIFQTIDPKNGRLNAPKKSTYDFFIYLQVEKKEEGDSFVSCNHCRLPHNVETLKEFARSFMQTNLVLTEEMVKYLASQIITSMRITLVYTSEDKLEEAKAAFIPYINLLVEMYKTGVNKLGEIANV